VAKESLKIRVKILVPNSLHHALREIYNTFHLLQSEKMATFALKGKVRKRALTFEQKILHKIAFDRNPMLTIYADKVKVREYVRQLIGSKYLIKSFGDYPNLENLTRSDFPRNFVLKSNHGSGGSLICWEGAPRGSSIPKDLSAVNWEKFLIHPDDLDWKDLVSLSNKWLTLNYYWTPGRYPEWAYKQIPPRLLAEELLLDENTLPFDYKFQMVNGKCAFIQVDASRFGFHRRNLYTKDWKPINAKTTHPKILDNLPKPRLLPEMLDIARTLSQNVDFIRVDLYSIGNQVFFGELTNYPNGGFAEIWPKSLSIDLASDWIHNFNKSSD